MADHEYDAEILRSAKPARKTRVMVVRHADEMQTWPHMPPPPPPPSVNSTHTRSRRFLFANTRNTRPRRANNVVFNQHLPKNATMPIQRSKQSSFADENLFIPGVL